MIDERAKVLRDEHRMEFDEVSVGDHVWYTPAHAIDHPHYEELLTKDGYVAAIYPNRRRIAIACPGGELPILTTARCLRLRKAAPRRPSERPLLCQMPAIAQCRICGHQASAMSGEAAREGHLAHASTAHQGVSVGYWEI